MFVLLGMAAAPVVAQDAACTSEEARRFDFWLGTWSLSWTGKDGRPERGRNIISKRHDGCVIVEEFDGRPDSPLTGTSVSTWVAKEGRWRQAWVDNTGSYLDFEGGWRDGRMVLSRRAPLAGPRVQQRMVFDEIRADSLVWTWQRSDDDGETWKTLWRIDYRRAP